MRFLFLFCLFLIISCSSDPSIIEAGVSKELADSRKSNISNIEYKLFFDIPLSKNDKITASNITNFDLKSVQDVTFDFKEDSSKVHNVIANGDTILLQFQNEHIIIPKSHLKSKNTIQIDFVAGDLSLNRNDDYLYTLFVPARARTVFPLFDQPNLKAKYQLNLIIPNEWKAVTNSKLESQLEREEKKSLVYETTKPISSYLFAFAVGDFQTLENKDGSMTMYYRESDTEKVNRNAKAIFDLHQSSLDYLERYTGIPYPFEKFDFALIPTFQYGGMEHPGSIFYREAALFLNEDPSINQQLSRASLIAHETAHMWFGDLVTMDWFNDVWLKEVFANFYAAKIVNPNFEAVNHELRFLLSHYPRAYSVDRSKGSHPIQQNLDNLDNAGSLYGAIIYQKAPIVMRNLEQFLGEEAFQEGIREYLNKYAFDNATWDNLIEIMAERTDRDLDQWNKDWIKSAGMPHLKFEEGASVLLNGTDGKLWSQNVKVSEDGIPNSDGYTYGYLEIPISEMEEQIRKLENQDDVIRATIWMNQWESLLNGQNDAAKLFDNLTKSIKVESNPLVLNYQFSIYSQLFWNWLSVEDRIDRNISAESMIFDKLMSSDDGSIKRITYNSYRNITTSSSGLSNLRQMWEGNLQGFALSLSENDKVRLAYDLYLKDYDANLDILDKQFENLKNEDNRKRMAFVRHSLSPDQEIRDSVFNSLLIADNRAQEPWVGQVLGYLHHPLRRSSSIQYLKPSLEVIEEVKNTGDIFFPTRWLSSTFSNHNTDEANDVVNSFLEVNTTLSYDLKNKIYQATDMLSRITNSVDQ